MKTIYKWGSAAAICAVGVGAYYAFFQDKEENVFHFQTSKLSKGDYVSKVQATGTLEPQELVDVGAQVTGEIKEFGTDVDGKRVDYGSEVKEGQLLARIDDTIVELDIKRAEASVSQAKAQIQSSEAAAAQARASIAQAEANKNKADRDLARAKKLGVGDALSQTSYDQYVASAESCAANLQSAQAQLQTAEAQRANAEAQLQSAEAQLQSQLRNRDYTHIKSPVDGTIVVRQVNVGQTVVSSMNATTLFLVARDLSKMQIWASVNEADIAKIQEGQEVRYTVDALPNENFSGRVNKIRPNATMTSNVVTYIVEVDIENPDRKLLPYMSANANFIVKEVKDCYMVSDAAFDFHPAPEMLAGDPPKGGKGPKGEAPEPPDAEGGERPADAPCLLWRKVDEQHVAPIRVIKKDSDGTRSIVEAVDGDSLSPDMELVTGITAGAASAAPSAKGGNNPFGMKHPERRQRSTGGAEAKPGQDTKNDRMGPPM